MCAVSQPSRRLRIFVERPNASSHKKEWNRLLRHTLELPSNIFYEIGHLLIVTLLRAGEMTWIRKRFRHGLLRVLMYISDCNRYTLRHRRSKDAAEFMRIIAPFNPEAHMRVAMNLAMLTDGAQALHPFFHYCVFLANGKVAVGANEADVVSRFVKMSYRSFTHLPSDGPDYVRHRFNALYMDAIWSLLNDEPSDAEKKIKSKRLWDSLDNLLKEKLKEEDMLHIVGTLIFAHHRVTPHGNGTGALLPQLPIADFLICKVLGVVAEVVSTCLKSMHAALKARRKNRRRTLSKKRRHNGTIAPAQVEEDIAWDLLKTVVNFETTVPLLSGLSFLCLYWRHERFAPRRDDDLVAMAETLRALRCVSDGLVEVAKLSTLMPLMNNVANKLASGTRAALPATTEDIMFSKFQPVLERDLLREVHVPEVPLAAVVSRDVGDTDVLRTAIRTLGEESFETAVAKLSGKHRDALVKQSLRDMGCVHEARDAAAAGKMVVLTVRKYRVVGLIRDLEKVNGGRLARMEVRKADKDDEGRRGHGEDLPDGPDKGPHPAQKIHGESRSSDEDSEVRRRVRKRRRLVGDCTPVGPVVADSSGSMACVGGTFGAGQADERRQKEGGGPRRREMEAKQNRENMELRCKGDKTENGGCVGGRWSACYENMQWLRGSRMCFEQGARQLTLRIPERWAQCARWDVPCDRAGMATDGLHGRYEFGRLSQHSSSQRGLAERRVPVQVPVPVREDHSWRDATMDDYPVTICG